MLRKLLPWNVLFLLLVLTLAACGGAAAPTAPTAPTAPAAEVGAAEATTEVVAVPDSGERETLTIWGFEGETDYFQKLVDAFEVQYPNVDVVVTNVPEAEYTTKIETALLAGEPPDLGFVYEPKWIAAGHFLPVDETLEVYNINVDDYNPGAMAANCLVDGHVYCVGTYTGAIMLFYNKDIFDAAGVEYPSATEPMTMDEYVAMAQAVTKKGDTLEDSIWGADADIGIWWQDWRNFVGEDGTKVEGFVNDEATVHSFDNLVQLRTDGSVLSGADQATMQGVDLMANGQLATSIVENNISIGVLENAGIRWGAALVPVEVQGDKAWVSTWTDGVSIFSKAKNKEAAADFVAFQATTGNELRLADGYAPLKIAMLDAWAGTSEGRLEAAQVLKASRPNIFVPGYWDVTAPLYDAFYGDMLEDGRPAQEVLDEYAPAMQATLDQAWETWNSFQPTE